MGTTKTIAFTERQNKIAQLAKALGHPARIAILQMLIRQPGCICGDIVDELDLAQSTISQHLKELKKAGIIQGTISGPKTCYCIDPVTLSLAEELFNQLFTDYKNLAQDCC